MPAARNYGLNGGRRWTARHPPPLSPLYVAVDLHTCVNYGQNVKYSNMIRCYLGASAVDFYTDFNVVVMVMALFDCSSQPYVTISTASQSTYRTRSHRRHSKVIVTSMIDRPLTCKAATAVPVMAEIDNFSYLVSLGDGRVLIVQTLSMQYL